MVSREDFWNLRDFILSHLNINRFVYNLHSKLFTVLNINDTLLISFPRYDGRCSIFNVNNVNIVSQ